MTYVPIPRDEQKGHGRPSLDIPEALLSQLRHSRSTGARCVIEDIGPDDEEALAELRRTLIRAGYRHFSEQSIYRRREGTTFTYWVGPKSPRRGRKKK
jgi:hypothetical protein